jgi:hypothetical protein
MSDIVAGAVFRLLWHATFVVDCVRTLFRAGCFSYRFPGMDEISVVRRVVPNSYVNRMHALGRWRVRWAGALYWSDDQILCLSVRKPGPKTIASIATRERWPTTDDQSRYEIWKEMELLTAQISKAPARRHDAPGVSICKTPGPPDLVRCRRCAESLLLMNIAHLLTTPVIEFTPHYVRPIDSRKYWKCCPSVSERSDVAPITVRSSVFTSSMDCDIRG